MSYALLTSFLPFTDSKISSMETINRHRSTRAGVLAVFLLMGFEWASIPTIFNTIEIAIVAKFDHLIDTTPWRGHFVFPLSFTYYGPK